MDVFNFKHEDYLQLARRDGRNIARGGETEEEGKAVGSPSGVALSEKPKAGTSAQRSAAGQQRKQKSNKNPSSTAAEKHRQTRKARNQPKHDYQIDDDDDEDNEDYYADNHSNPSTLYTIFSTLFRLTLTTLRFISIPFSLLFSLLLSLFRSVYHYSRVALSTTLQPVVYFSAPLTYLLSGIVYVFLQVPLIFVLGIARELYPVYIFWGSNGGRGRDGWGCCCGAVFKCFCFC